jgi:hypothetical protein
MLLTMTTAIMVVVVMMGVGTVVVTMEEATVVVAGTFSRGKHAYTAGRLRNGMIGIEALHSSAHS